MSADILPKLCVDCAHHQSDSMGSDFDRCKAPQNRSAPDLVRGVNGFNWTFCHNARSAAANFSTPGCGADALWFEPLSEAERLNRDAGIAA